MEYYLIIVGIFLLFASLLLLVSRGLAEKILIFNFIGSLGSLFIAMLSSFDYYRSYIDIAIIYSLFSFIAIKALIYYQKNKVE